ncbi:unnamed protein product, partial [Scytosiphon promiscuus]
SFKKSVSSHRSFLVGDIRDGLGHFLFNLLQEDASLMDVSISDLFRGAKERLMGINAQDVVHRPVFPPGVRTLPEGPQGEGPP